MGTLGKGEHPPMLWWLVGLWLLSPVLLPIFWLLGMLASPSGSELNGPTDKTSGTIGAFAAPARPATSRRARGAQAQLPVVRS